LQSDIEELISLTRENVLSVQKQVKERGLPAQAGTADRFDEEYGLLKVSQGCGALCWTVCLQNI
jgi:hypothetical protein